MKEEALALVKKNNNDITTTKHLLFLMQVILDWFYFLIRLSRERAVLADNPEVNPPISAVMRMMR